MRSSALIALACAALLGGCGGSSEEEKVKQAFDDYVQAVKDKDVGKFCDSVITPDLVEVSRSERDKAVEGCKDDLSPKIFGDTSAAPLADAEVGEITVEGDQATAEVTTTERGKKESAKTPFLKVDGDWKVRLDLSQ